MTSNTETLSTPIEKLSEMELKELRAFYSHRSRTKTIGAARRQMAAKRLRQIEWEMKDRS